MAYIKMTPCEVMSLKKLSWREELRRERNRAIERTELRERRSGERCCVGKSGEVAWIGVAAAAGKAGTFSLGAAAQSLGRPGPRKEPPRIGAQPTWTRLTECDWHTRPPTAATCPAKESRYRLGDPGFLIELRQHLLRYRNEELKRSSLMADTRGYKIKSSKATPKTVFLILSANADSVAPRKGLQPPSDTSLS